MLVVVTASFIILSACGDTRKSAFLESCIKEGDSKLSAEQSKFNCNCAADAIFSNKNISDEAKKSLAEGKDMFQLPEDDTGLIMGLGMTCYAQAQKQ